MISKARELIEKEIANTIKILHDNGMPTETGFINGLRTALLIVKREEEKTKPDISWLVKDILNMSDEINGTRIQFNANNLPLYKRALEQIKGMGLRARIVAHHNYDDQYFIEVHKTWGP